MCLSGITKIFKKGKNVIGWKIAYKKTNKEFSPVYQCTADRYKIGKWYRANYKSAQFKNTKTGRYVTQSGAKYGKIIDRIIKSGLKYGGLIPTVGAHSGKEYECGFHFFKIKKDVRQFIFDNQLHDYSVIKCEFKGVVTEGRQWRHDIGVARQQKIIKLIPKKKLTKKWTEA